MNKTGLKYQWHDGSEKHIYCQTNQVIEESGLKGSYCWEAAYILTEGIRDNGLGGRPLQLRKVSTHKEWAKGISDQLVMSKYKEL